MCLMLTNNLTNNSMNTKLKCTFGYKINTSISEEYNRNIIIKQEESAMVFEQGKNSKQNQDKREKYSIK